MPELCFPLLAMRLHLVLEMYEGEHVRQLVQQGNEKTVRVQIGIDTDAVMRIIPGGITIIPEHAFALVCYGKVYGMGLKERGNLFIRSIRQELTQKTHCRFLLFHTRLFSCHFR